MNRSQLDYIATRPRPSRKQRWRIPLAVAASVALAFGLSAVLMVGMVVGIYRSTADSYPPLGQQISERGTGLTTIFDRHGESIGVLNNPNSAIAAPVGLDQISNWLLLATVSTEDNEFWTHNGFDPRGLVRASWTTYVQGDEVTGGSTITQQLVKTAFFTTECEETAGVQHCYAPRTIERKLKELALSIDADERYSKEQILGWYLNSISYAGRYVGVEAASQGYFDKPAAELSLPESATLAGLPSAPTRYNPRTNCVTEASDLCIRDERGMTLLAGEAKARQEYVLDLMATHGHISVDEATAAKAEPVYVSPDVTENKAGGFIDSQVEPRLVRMCEAGLLPQLKDSVDCTESVHSAGYRVTTTLDLGLNDQAVALLNTYLNQGLAAGCDCHNGSVVTIEPASGEILVYVPSIDPTWVSDPRVAGNIDQAAEIHQPGSSFKPAVYLAWMDALNKTPMSAIWDTNPLNLLEKPEKPEDQVTIQNPGRNAGASPGLISARAALGGSQNVPSFRAASEAGVENVISMAKALGITTLDQGFDPTFRYHPGMIYGPAIATGGANVRVVDMAYVDATIANMGVMVGVPTYASTLDPKDALSVSTAEGDNLELALTQRDAFLHGHLRLPGTRTLDPVVVLKVEALDGTIIYEAGMDIQQKPVVNAGSVWMLHSIMSDCTARFLIWSCGSSNSDLSLDSFVNGVMIPGGVKTGTQQGTTAAETLETWMTGYSRYAATAVWIGNANKSAVRDGPEANYASANATVRLFKTWMGAYHEQLQANGVFTTPEGFDSLKPENVALAPFQSASNERGSSGGCFTRVTGWQRTDINYLGGDCLSKACVPLPALRKDLAIALARSRGIPACGVALPPPPPSATASEPATSPGSASVTPLPRQSPAPQPTPKPTKDPEPKDKPTEKPNERPGGSGPPGGS